MSADVGWIFFSFRPCKLHSDAIAMMPCYPPPHSFIHYNTEILYSSPSKLAFSNSHWLLAVWRWYKWDWDPLASALTNEDEQKQAAHRVVIHFQIEHLEPSIDRCLVYLQIIILCVLWWIATASGCASISIIILCAWGIRQLLLHTASLPAPLAIVCSPSSSPLRSPKIPNQTVLMRARLQTKKK